MLIATSAALFALGLTGVIVRRNVLVMLMCMELMLNGVNLSLVAFAQQSGIDRRRRAGVPGLRRRHGGDRHRRSDRASARSPQAGARPRRVRGSEGIAGEPSAEPDRPAAAGGIPGQRPRGQPLRQEVRLRGRLRAARAGLRRCRVVRDRARVRGRRAPDRDRVHVGRHRRPHVRDRVLLRPPDRGHGADRDGRRLAHPRLFDRLHEGRRELRAVLRVPQPVPVLHADARAGPLAARAVRRLGRCRPRVVSADRLLVRGSRQGPRGQEGVHHQPDRRRGLPARHVRALPGARHARHGSDQRGVPRAGGAGGVGEPRRHPAVHRRDGQVRADPAARLAARMRWPARRPSRR